MSNILNNPRIVILAILILIAIFAPQVFVDVLRAIVDLAAVIFAPLGEALAANIKAL